MVGLVRMLFSLISYTERFLLLLPLILYLPDLIFALKYMVIDISLITVEISLSQVFIL